MRIQVNGEDRTIDQPAPSIQEILVLCKVEMPEMVSVQKNGQFVDRKDFPTSIVVEGDVVDFLYFMGGGSR